ncbi:hypothetical protein B0H34DRAFT_204465 [Crassisporium funariophilum]|nr:hypothetical protein B0H34DRAFT_204465 [Crassisporium funariophilum]
MDEHVIHKKTLKTYPPNFVSSCEDGYSDDPAGGESCDGRQSVSRKRGERTEDHAPKGIKDCNLERCKARYPVHQDDASVVLEPRQAIVNCWLVNEQMKSRRMNKRRTSDLVSVMAKTKALITQSVDTVGTGEWCEKRRRFDLSLSIRRLVQV